MKVKAYFFICMLAVPGIVFAATVQKLSVVASSAYVSNNVSLKNAAAESEVVLVSGLYKAKDQSLLQIGLITKTGFVLEQAYSEYAPECSMVKALTFTQTAPNIFIWNKDKCKMTLTKFTGSNSILLNVNALDKCFTQYDADQPFMCFGNPMTETQGNYIVGRVYNLDTAPGDNINR